MHLIFFSSEPSYGQVLFQSGTCISTIFWQICYKRVHFKIVGKPAFLSLRVPTYRDEAIPPPNSIIDCRGLLRRPRNDIRMHTSTYKDDMHPQLPSFTFFNVGLKFFCGTI